MNIQIAVLYVRVKNQLSQDLLFDKEKINFNQVVSIELKQNKSKWIYLTDLLNKLNLTLVTINVKEVVVSKIIQL